MDNLLFFSYNHKSSVLLIFFFNALVFSFLLFKKGITENKQDSNWLALFILLGGLYICPFMLGYAGWYSVKSYREFLFFVPFQQLLLIGPVLYFCIQSLLNSQFQLVRKDALHFLPAGLYLLYSLVVFIVDKWVLDEFYFYADGQDKDLDFWYQMAGLLSMLFYLFMSLKDYRRYRNRTVQEVSYADEIAFKWVEHFMLAFGFILLLRILFFILNPEWGEFGSKYWYYLCFSMLLLYISIAGYAHSVKTSGSVNFASTYLPILEPEEELTEHEAPDLLEWKHKIIALFAEQQAYKNPSLTLTDVANALGTNRNMISRVINQEFDINFNDFVNQKRVEAIIKQLNQGAHISNTLLSIALDCGFNSKTTFNRAFKKETSITPKQFIEQYEHKNLGSNDHLKRTGTK